MANRIKGITMEIGGDTTKLKTALKGVNSEIRNTQEPATAVQKIGAAAVKTAAGFDSADVWRDGQPH